MKLHPSSEEIIRVGVETESEFTIKTTAKAFDILSSGLYTDPIYAVIRELSCNAYDAHVDADKSTVPFEIHLPNRLEPFFGIKDFGTGLSDEDVQQLYTTYFDSTKTKSNDFIGALGLGSKSPFSYTKAYEVMSRFDGTIRTYSLFINEDGIPEVAKMNTQPTTESNGLEIRVGVEISDFNKFHDKTANALKFFPVKPKITGVLHFAFDTYPDPVIKNARWISTLQRTGITAVQGNVQYKVTLSHLTDMLTPIELKWFQYMHCTLFFDIGSLDVAASREEIRYDKQTILTLATRIKTVHQDIMKEIRKIAKDSKTYWNLCVNISEFSSKLMNETNIKHILKLLPTQRNQLLERYVKSSGSVKVPTLLGHDFVKYSSPTSYSARGYSRSHITHSFYPSTKTVIVYNDVKVGGINRVSEYLHNTSDISRVLVIKKRKTPIVILDNKLETIPFVGYDEEYLKLVESLGNPTIHQLSKLCPPKVKDPEVKKRLKTFKYFGTTWVGNNRTVSWSSSTLNVNGGLYFVLKGGYQMVGLYGDRSNARYIHWSAHDTAGNLTNMCKLVNGMIGTEKYTKTDIVGMTVATWRTIKDDPNWVDVFSLVEKSVLPFKKETTHSHRMLHTVDEYSFKQALAKVQIRQLIQSELPTTSPFRQMLLPMMKNITKYGHEDKFAKFCSDLIATLVLDTTVDNSPYFLDNDIIEKYPMIKVLETVPNRINDWQEILNYIKIIDNQP